MLKYAVQSAQFIKKAEKKKKKQIYADMYKLYRSFVHIHECFIASQSSVWKYRSNIQKSAFPICAHRGVDWTTLIILQCEEKTFVYVNIF